MKARTAIISKKGGRSNNEDAADYVQTPAYGCWIVADGLGGHNFGELASSIVVNELLSEFKADPEVSEQGLERYLQSAQDELLKHQRLDRRYSEMRTTLVMLVSDYRYARCAHIGDSRLYYFRGGRIDFQTRDHSVPQAMVNAGECRPEEIRFHEDRNRLLRVMGMEWEKPRYEIRAEQFVLKRGDVFLLCTDGFWEYITEDEMEGYLAEAYGPEEWLKKMEERMLSYAPGNMDNYTASAVFFI